jgi:hypothetical protein
MPTQGKKHTFVAYRTKNDSDKPVVSLKNASR